MICFGAQDNIGAYSLLYYTNATTFIDGAWHQVAGVLNISTFQQFLYWDNSLVASMSVTKYILLNGSATLSVGVPPWVMADTAWEFLGTFDEVRLSNTARTNFIPEPWSFTLLGLAGLGRWLCRHRVCR